LITFIGGFLINFEALLGKMIIDTGGYILGEVKGATVDEKTRYISLLHVKLSDNADAGFQEKVSKRHNLLAREDGCGCGGYRERFALA
jgi:sporulation protein YlmC with PRC-barrel domain